MVISYTDRLEKPMVLTTKEVLICSFTVIMMAILSQITIPIWPVPINTTHIAIFVAACLLTPKMVVISHCMFLALGIVGLPVFSNFGFGLATLLGPTGGFLLGYIFCALVVSVLSKRSNTSFFLARSMAIGLLVNYVFGISFLMLVLRVDIFQALLFGFFPFIIGDTVKIIFSIMLVKRIRKTLI